MEELYYVSDRYSYIIGPKVVDHIPAKIVNHRGHRETSTMRYPWRPYDPNAYTKVELLI